MTTLDINKIKNNDIVAITHYVKVTKVNPKQYEFFGNDIDKTTNSMKIQGKDIIDAAFSADQFAEEQKVTKTQAAELLVSSFNRPFTVNFTKSDDSERTLRGRLVSPEPLLGRSMVEDLDESKNRLRQVDHRTINWLILNNIKYIVK